MKEVKKQVAGQEPRMRIDQMAFSMIPTMGLHGNDNTILIMPRVRLYAKYGCVDFVSLLFKEQLMRGLFTQFCAD